MTTKQPISGKPPGLRGQNYEKKVSNPWKPKFPVPPLLYGTAAMRTLDPILSARGRRPPYLDRGALSGLQQFKRNATAAATMVSTKTDTPKSVGPFKAETFLAPMQPLSVHSPRFRGPIHQDSANADPRRNEPINGQRSKKSALKEEPKLDVEPFKTKVTNLAGNIGAQAAITAPFKKPYDFHANSSMVTPYNRDAEQVEPRDDSLPNYNSPEFREKLRLIRKKKYWTRKEYSIVAPPKKSVLKESRPSSAVADSLLISDAYQLDAEVMLRNATKLLVKSYKLQPRFSNEEQPTLEKPGILPSKPQADPDLSFKNTPKGTYRYEERKKFLMKRGFTGADIDEFLLGKDWNKKGRVVIKVPQSNIEVKTGKTDMTLGPFDFIRGTEETKIPKVYFAKNQIPKCDGTAGKSGRNIANKHKVLSDKITKVKTTNQSGTKQLKAETPEDASKYFKAKPYNSAGAEGLKSSSSFEIDSSVDLSSIKTDPKKLHSTKGILQHRFREMMSDEVKEVTRENIESLKNNFIQKIIESQVNSKSKGASKPDQKSAISGKLPSALAELSKDVNYPGLDKDPSAVQPKTNFSILKKNIEAEPKPNDIKVKVVGTKKVGKSRLFLNPPKGKSGGKDSIEAIKERIQNPRNPRVKKLMSMKDISKLMTDLPPAKSGAGVVNVRRSRSILDRVSLMPVVIPFGGLPEKRSSGPFEIMDDMNEQYSIPQNLDTKEVKEEEPKAETKSERKQVLPNLYSPEQDAYYKKKFEYNQQFRESILGVKKSPSYVDENLDKSQTVLNFQSSSEQMKENATSSTNKSQTSSRSRANNRKDIGEYIYKIKSSETMNASEFLRNLETRDKRPSTGVEDSPFNQSIFEDPKIKLTPPKKKESMKGVIHRRIKKILEKEEDARYEQTLAEIRDKLKHFRQNKPDLRN